MTQPPPQWGPSEQQQYGRFEPPQHGRPQYAPTGPPQGGPHPGGAHQAGAHQGGPHAGGAHQAGAYAAGPQYPPAGPPQFPPPPYQQPWGLTPAAAGSQHAEARSAAVRQMAIGAIVCLVGLGITLVTYAVASGDGGHYVVAYGPAIFGLIAFVRGLIAYRRA